MIEEILSRLEEIRSDTAKEMASKLMKDYSSFIEYLFYLESLLEIDYLSSIGKTLEGDDDETFKRRVKQRWESRQYDTQNGFPFHLAPGSLTHKLYWDLAEVFCETPQERMNFLFPKVKYQLQVELEEYDSLLAPKARREQMKTLELRLKKYPLAQVTLELKHEDLSHCVFFRDFFFDARDIAAFPLSRHLECYRLLSQQEPDFVAELYQHNSRLAQLLGDMEPINNKGQGLAPLEAIERLIRWSILGGERRTGDHYYAAEFANQAVEDFLNYFCHLPEDLQTGLKELGIKALHEGKEITISLGSVIDDELGRGKCVETSATHLKWILEQHKGNPLLREVPPIFQENRLVIEAKYAFPAKDSACLNTQKESLNSTFLPQDLAKAGFARMPKFSAVAFFDLILKFSPEFYVFLVENLPFREDFFPKFMEYIPALSIEQKKSLAAAFYPFCLQNVRPICIIDFISQVKDKEFLQALVDCYLEERFDWGGQSKRDQARLVWAFRDNPEGLAIVLQKFPEVQWLSLMNSTAMTPLHQGMIKQGRTLLHYAAFNAPNLLFLLLDLLPIEVRYQAIELRDDHGVSVLEAALRSQPCLFAIRRVLTPKETAQLLQNSSSSLNYFIELAKNKDFASFKELLMFLPSATRGTFLIQTEEGKKALCDFLSKTCSNISTFAKSQRFALICMRNQQGFGYLDAISQKSVTEFCATLLFLLKNLPKDKKVALLHAPSGLNNASILHLLFDKMTKEETSEEDIASLDKLFSSLDETGKFHLLTHLDACGNILLGHALFDEAYQKILFSLRSISPSLVQSWFEVHSPRALQNLVHEPISSASIFNTYPQEKKIPVLIQIDPETGCSLLYLIVAHEQTLVALLEQLSRENRQALSHYLLETIEGSGILCKVIASYPEVLHILGELCRQEGKGLAWLEFLKKKDEEGKGFLMYSLKNIKTLIYLISVLPIETIFSDLFEPSSPEERIRLISQHELIIQKAMSRLESFQELWALYPEEERIPWLKSQNYALLHRAIDWEKSPEGGHRVLGFLLRSVPTSERLELMFIPNPQGKTLCDRVKGKPRLLETLLRSLTLSERKIFVERGSEHELIGGSLECLQLVRAGIGESGEWPVSPAVNAKSPEVKTPISRKRLGDLSFFSPRESKKARASSSPEQKNVEAFFSPLFFAKEAEKEGFSPPPGAGKGL